MWLILLVKSYWKKRDIIWLTDYLSKVQLFRTIALSTVDGVNGLIWSSYLTSDFLSTVLVWTRDNEFDHLFMQLSNA